MSKPSESRWTGLLTCEDAFRHLDDYMDDALSAERKRLVDEHLAACDQCTDEYRFERSLLDHLREKLQSLEVPPDLRSRISRRIREDGR